MPWLQYEKQSFLDATAQIILISEMTKSTDRRELCISLHQVSLLPSSCRMNCLFLPPIHHLTQPWAVQTLTAGGKSC